MRLVYFMGGVAVGGGLLLWLTQPTTEGKCCARVALGARDELATRTGIPGSFFDFFGVTNHLPALLDKAGLL